MGYYGWGWRPYVSVAQRRRKAAREMEKLKKKGHAVSPVDHRRPHDRHDLLGQGLVREPRAVQRLCQPAAARADLCAQRVGGRSADCARRDRTPMVSGSELYKVELKVAPRRQGAVEVHLQGLRRRHRFAGRAAARTVVQGRHGADLPPGTGPVPVAGRDPAFVQLPRLGRHVQACRGGAVWHRRAVRSPARTSLPPA